MEASEPLRKVLRENDPRIHEAAQAYYSGNITEYKRIFKEIRNDDKHNTATYGKRNKGN